MAAWIAVLCSIAVVLERVVHISCVSTNDFFPYGTGQGDYSLDDTSIDVSLPEDFTFLGETFSTLQVSMHDQCREGGGEEIQ